MPLSDARSVSGSVAREKRLDTYDEGLGMNRAGRVRDEYYVSIPEAVLQVHLIEATVDIATDPVHSETFKR